MSDFSSNSPPSSSSSFPSLATTATAVTPQVVEKTAELVAKFQRDLNRVLDTDRNTRKRGIQNLIDEIPWESSVKSLFQSAQPSLSAKQLLKSGDSKDSKSSKKDKDKDKEKAVDITEAGCSVMSEKALAKAALRLFVKENLLAPLLVIVRDPVEKCRELGMQLLMMAVKTSTGLPDAFIDSVVHAIAERIGQFPFIETSEEIRILNVDLLLMIIKHKYFIHNHKYSNSSSSSSNSGGDSSRPKEKEVDASKHIRFPDSLITVVITIVSKALMDSCPNVKKSTCDVILEMCSLTTGSSLDLNSSSSGFRYFVRLQFKELLSGLLSNMFHQHSKVRSVTISALGAALSCLVDGYETTASETVLAALHKMKFDKIPTILLSLTNLCNQVITQSPQRLPYMYRSEYGSQTAAAVAIAAVAVAASEVSASGPSAESSEAQSEKPPVITLCPADCSLVEILIILSGNENEDVKSLALARIGEIATLWRRQNDAGRVDAANASEDMIEFFNAHASNIIPSLIKNTTEWTAELRLNYIRGLRSFLRIFQMSFQDSADKSAGSYKNQFFVGVLGTLATAAKDFESEVRMEALAACEVCGAAFANIGENGKNKPSLGDCISLILPHITGVESTNHKSGWTLLLAYILSGYGNRTAVLSKEGGAVKDVADHDRNWAPISSACDILKIVDLYDTTSEALNESLLLLIRNLIDNFPNELNATESVKLNMAFALVFLLSKVKDGPVIPTAARIEMYKLSLLSNFVSYPNSINSTSLKSQSTDALLKDEAVKRKVDAKIQSFLKKYYILLMDMICGGSNKSSNSDSSGGGSRAATINWTSTSSEKNAFETLACLCPRSSWEHFARLFAIIEPQTKPPSFEVDKDSHEAHLKNYAAVDGTEEVATVLVNTRLSLIALLEGLITAGSQDWECGQYISTASENIMNKILLPNLVWRVGRVETMIRKVILATFYSLLKNGGVKPEHLFAAASNIVPPLISNLDDLDASNRNLAALCLSIIFYRLKGAFAESAIHNIYSKLLLRLDDSSDNVRIAICDTLVNFLQCAVPTAYSGTTIEYMLDQLFIHLDDPSQAIQEAVLTVIFTCSEVDAVVVMKKAIYYKNNLRDTVYCDKIVKHIESNHP